MRLILVVLFCINLYAIEQKTNLSYKYIFYDSFKNENLINVDTRFEYSNDKFDINGSFEYLYSLRYDRKRYFDINELYFSKQFSNSTFTIGKQIKYWGELEAYNITDIFNKKRYIFDPFDKDKKIGSYSITDTFYFDDSSFEFGAKLYEENIKYPNNNDPYYPFALNYEKSFKTTHSKYTPSLYLKYGFTTESIESENKIILWHGYDSKRAIILKDNKTLRQEAYIASKLLYLSNIIYDDYIFKIEGSISDVKTDIVSDYTQLSFGVEKSIYDIKGNDLTFYLEYYKYKYFNNLQKNIDISEVYNDDLFFAIKLNFNNISSTELKSGILYDRQSNEQVFKCEFKSRIKDGLVFKAELLNFDSKANSVLTPFGNDTRVTLGLTYSF